MRQQNNNGIVIFFLYRKYMRLFFVVSFYLTAVLKISQNFVDTEQSSKLLFIVLKIYAAIFVNTEQSSKLFFIVLKIYAAIFCRIILFEERWFEDFAKFCKY